jgi:hypothetical protein
MGLTIETPPSRRLERAWICDVLFKHFLGLDWRHVEADRRDVRISIDGERGMVTHPDVLFACPEADWRQERSLPREPLGVWDGGASPARSGMRLPVIYGADPRTDGDGDGGVRLPVDVCGSAFFLLSRYEEVVRPVADRHERFPAQASLALRAGFLERPLVNEYLEALWGAMLAVWPGLRRRHRRGSVFVTCDVDEPFDSAARQGARTARAVGGDLLRRRRPRLAAARLVNYVATRRGDRRFDPCNTFGWFMTACEAAGRRAAFYFIPERPAGPIDGEYALEDPAVVELMRAIAARGHELGVHGSYHSFRDGERIRRERGRMLGACEAAGIPASIAGNRQHYLRWDAAQTPDLLDAAGVGYDTTGSFADAPGFRYGTSWPFPMWSWRRERALRLEQRPLCVMEGSIFDEQYLGLGYTPAAMDKIEAIKAAATGCGGDFVLLWHNSHFLNPEDREFFKAAIA